MHLMTLLVSAINKETKTLMDNNIQLSTIGDTKSLTCKSPKRITRSNRKNKKEYSNDSWSCFKL